MASKSGKGRNAKGISNTRKKAAAQSSAVKKLITVLTVILIILLIVAIIVISVKGLWGEVIDYIKNLINGDETPSGEKPPIPAGTAKLEGDILEMRVLDIGQGDCILLIFPDGQIMVMDIGSENGTTSPWNVINGALTDLEITTIDYLFLTHTDYDHIREAKKLIENYEIKNFYFPKGVTGTTSAWKNAYEAAQKETYVENGVTKKSVYNENVGTYEISGENWIMKCYTYDEKDYPTKTDATSKNAVSPVCLLEYADKTIVLTGDSNYTNEEYLLAKGYFDNVDADVLKVAHHGSTTSTSEEFLNKVDCEYAIISTNGKSYGHPTPELLDRLDKYTDLSPDDDYNGFAQVYRTDQDGTITVQIDEKGVMNIIADENAEKNTTTGTPYVEGEEINEANVVAIVFTKRDAFGWAQFIA
ncbi:MAG: MBL fold metallo-hydrolase [Clostridia bacterium]|nr:MBL fold metallo-hydrolase [Clostridia bacterium]